MSQNSLLLEFKLPLRVYIEDTDAGGIVFYVNYLKFMERGRTEALRALGVEQSLLQPMNINFVVRDCNIRYRQSAHLDDELVVLTELAKIKRASVVFKQSVMRDQQLLAQAQLTVATVAMDTGRPIALPALLTQKFVQ